MVINVHAGHNPDGKIACGAVGFIKESTEARKVKDEVISQLRQLGNTVYDCTVNNGTSQSNVLSSIVKKCNAHKVGLDVSIHFNSGVNDKKGNDKTTGTEVYVYNSDSKARSYAIKVVKEIAKLGFNDRGVKYSSGLYVLRNTESPAMLIECCFVDDKDDAQLYDYMSMAKAIVYGITGRKVAQSNSSNVESKLYRVQVGAYKDKSNAIEISNKLKADGYEAVIIEA